MIYAIKPMVKEARIGKKDIFDYLGSFWMCMPETVKKFFFLVDCRCCFFEDHWTGNFKFFNYRGRI